VHARSGAQKRYFEQVEHSWWPQKKDALKISKLVSVFFILSPKNGE
jgi:hypothetical protein